MGRTRGLTVEVVEDGGLSDVVPLLMANAGLVERAHGITDEASARLTALLLDGLRAQAATVGPAAPSARDVVAAMRHNGQRRFGSSKKR